MATQSITLSVPHAEGFAAARGAAASIFKLMDRNPAIDTFKKGGTAPRRVVGEITLEDVHFSYPSRPDVQVSFPLQFTKQEHYKFLTKTQTHTSTRIHVKRDCLRFGQYVHLINGSE